MKNPRAPKFIQGLLIAAIYGILALLQDLLFPGFASYALQFRISEALCILALFTPSAIWGVSLGCLLFNFVYIGTLPLDWFVGTVATALGAMAMYQLRNVTIQKIPFPALLIPVATNGLLVGGELTIYRGRSFLLNMLGVALGETVVLFTLGLGLYFVLHPLKERLFGDQ